MNKTKGKINDQGQDHAQDGVDTSSEPKVKFSPPSKFKNKNKPKTTLKMIK